MLGKHINCLYPVAIGSVAILILCYATMQSSSNRLRIVSAWSWFSDPRAIVVDKSLVIGSVDNRGFARVDVVCTNRNVITDSQRISTLTEVDDHCNPALLSLGDGRILAAYAQHGRDEHWFSRVGKMDSNRGRISWGEERTHTVGATVTYSNLLRLKQEKNRIYNFFRGLNYNPTFVYSDDEGETWSSPSIFLVSGQGDIRPYVKYFSDGQERIDFLYTQGHPRDIDSSIYHCYYLRGDLFRTDGTKISQLASDSNSPMAPERGSLVFNGSNRHPAWVWDIRRSSDGRVAAVFVVSHDWSEGFDLRYHYAHVMDGVWQTKEIAYAGKHLYTPENHYAGGVVLDPSDLDVVYISCNVDPLTGTPCNEGTNQLYRGSRAPNSQFKFQPFSEQTGINKLRPFACKSLSGVVRILWLEGAYTSYTDYATRVRWANVDDLNNSKRPTEHGN